MGGSEAEIIFAGRVRVSAAMGSEIYKKKNLVTGK
jgi:hypothetical protein